jgi:general secretion pathway protein I
MRRHLQRARAGFTLLEVMLAVAIMAIALGSVFSAQAGAVKMAQRARKLAFATLLARCKMGEIEEHVAKKGLPTIQMTDSDECCKDSPIEGFRCKWEIVPVVLPEAMFNGENEEGKDSKNTGGGKVPNLGPNASNSQSEGKSKGGLNGLLGAAAAALGGKKDGASKDDKTDSKDKDKESKDKSDLTKDPSKVLSGDPSQFLAGNKEGGGGDVDSLTAMAMQFVYPVLKPAFESQIRRASISVNWSEGSADKTFELTQYIVAEQPVPLAIDPNNPNAMLNGSGSMMGTSPSGGSSTSPSTGSTP